MFGGRELNVSLYSSFFSWRINIFGWYTWGVVVQGRRARCDVNRYVQCDLLGRPRSLRIILEDTRDIWTRGIQSIARKEILDKTDRFERLRVSASHRSL